MFVTLDDNLDDNRRSDPLGAPVLPNEAESPLVVDPNAVLTRPAAAQSFQPISRRRR
jgi:hypothetical protein